MPGARRNYAQGACTCCGRRERRHGGPERRVALKEARRSTTPSARSSKAADVPDDRGDDVCPTGRDDATNDGLKNVEEDDLELREPRRSPRSRKIAAEAAGATRHSAEDPRPAVRTCATAEKPAHPFTWTKRGKKTMSRQEKKALMESKMQRTKLFLATKVTKKERRLRQEAAAAAEPEPPSRAGARRRRPRGASRSSGDRAAEAEKKKQRENLIVNRRAWQQRRRRKKTWRKTFENDDSPVKRLVATRALPPLASVGRFRRPSLSLFASNAERFDVVGRGLVRVGGVRDDALRVTKPAEYCYVTSRRPRALDHVALMSRYGGACLVAPNARREAGERNRIEVFVGDAVRRGVDAIQGHALRSRAPRQHGPVFRAMLHVEKIRGPWPAREGFLAQCDACGETRGADGWRRARMCPRAPPVRRSGVFAVLTGKSDDDAWPSPGRCGPGRARRGRGAEAGARGGRGGRSGERRGVFRKRRRRLSKRSASDEGPMSARAAAAPRSRAEADPALPVRRTGARIELARGARAGAWHAQLDEWVRRAERMDLAASRRHWFARGLKSDGRWTTSPPPETPSRTRAKNDAFKKRTVEVLPRASASGRYHESPRQRLVRKETPKTERRFRDLTVRKKTTRPAAGEPS